VAKSRVTPASSNLHSKAERHNLFFSVFQKRKLTTEQPGSLVPKEFRFFNLKTQKNKSQITTQT
jgi:hypothetical protein